MFLQSRSTPVFMPRGWASLPFTMKGGLRFDLLLVPGGVIWDDCLIGRTTEDTMA